MNRKTSEVLRIITFFILGFSLFFVMFILFGCASKDKVVVEGRRIAVEAPLEKKTGGGNPQAPDIRISAQESQDTFPVNTHRYPNIRLQTDGFKESYKKDIGKTPPFITAKPVIRDGHVYVLNDRPEIRGYRISDGKMVKSKRLKQCETTGAGLGIDQDRIFVTCAQGRIFALTPDLKEIVWQVDIKAPLRTPPISDGKKVFVYTKAGELIAMDAKTGKESWRRNTLFQESGPLLAAEITVEKNTVMVASTTGEVWGFDKETGLPVFTKKISGERVVLEADSSQAITATPFFDGERIIAASPKNVLMAVGREGKEPIWLKDVGISVTPVKMGNVLYAVTEDNVLLAVNSGTGAVYFEKNIPLKGRATGLLLAGDHLVLTSEGGNIALVDPKSGSLKKKIKTKEDIYLGPVAGGDTLFVLTNEGNLYAYR